MNNYQLDSFISNTYVSLPLGKMLQEAQLVSTIQIDIALQYQRRFTKLRLGEIMVLKGWLKPQTADFFADNFPAILKLKNRHKLGGYLKKAGLLSQEQINYIVSEQDKYSCPIRFGQLVVINGWLKQGTLSFFLDTLLTVVCQYHCPCV